MQAQQQKTQAKAKYDDRATDAEILDIPELEEEGKEDLSRVVRVRTCAHASVSVYFM